MSHFPISKSFLQREALARRIEEEYGFEEVDCQLITSTLRDVYLVTSSQGRNVLYVYPQGLRTKSEIAAEWQYVDYLHACGVPVAPAVPRKSGEVLLTFEGPEGIRFGVLTRFAEGVILRRRPTVAAVRAYGQSVARIHVYSDRMPFTPERAPLDYERMIQESVAAFEREAHDRREEQAFLHAARDILLDGLGHLSKAKSSYGMIHGDVIRANALVTEDDRVTVLDFDFCGWGWRAYDVASYLLTIRNTAEEGLFERAFLDGYNEIRPLTSTERETFVLFEAIRAIYSIGVPAMNIPHWGSLYFYAFLDSNLVALMRCMEALGMRR